MTPITESEFGPVSMTAAFGTRLVPSVTVTLIVPTWRVRVAFSLRNPGLTLMLFFWAVAFPSAAVTE